MRTTRRQLLVAGIQVSAAPLVARLAQALPAAPRDGERVLVVLELTGGNDGLNTLVPHRQDGYNRARPTLAQPRSALHALDDDHGLHPELGPLAELYHAGQLALVHGVGYPGPSRSHFRSMDVWHGADPGHARAEQGWLGRLADQLARAQPEETGAMVALHVGAGALPLALRGRAVFPATVRDPRGLQLTEVGPELARARSAALASASDQDGELAFLRAAARTTYAASERMTELARARASVAYPEHELARRLSLVAQLVTGGFGTRIFYLSFGGFDTHSAQRATHAALLAELATSLAAFQRDLAQHGAHERVATLVFSEFGRRVRENGSKGTDHGAAAPVLVLSGAARGGLHGTPPDLEHLDDGDVAYTSDFRSVYAALERDWMGLAPSSALEPLALLRA